MAVRKLRRLSRIDCFSPFLLGERMRVLRTAQIVEQSNRNRLRWPSFKALSVITTVVAVLLAVSAAARQTNATAASRPGPRATPNTAPYGERDLRGVWN